jgi:diguanylate cyclase (GGDEF)-like protein
MSITELPLLSAPALPILESLPVGIMVTDVNNVVRWVNEALCAQLGVASDELIGKEIGQLSAQKVPTTAPGAERFYVPPKAGQPERWLECITRTMASAEGTPWNLVCALDISRNRHGKKSFGPALDLIDMSRLDSATGLLTKKAIVQELISQLTRSRRYHNPLSILMLRVNEVKEVGQGNPPMAAVLKAVTGVLKDKLRWVDSAGHWDNSDILLVLPETGVDSACKLAEKIYPLISKIELEGSRIVGKQFPVGMGVTGWHKDDDITRLIGRASGLLTEGEGQPVNGIRSV